MRSIVLTFVLALGWVMPAAAQTNTAVSNWRAYCFETRASRETAFALADAAGWTTAQAPTVTRFHPDGSVLLIPDAQGNRSSCVTSHPSGAENATATMQALLQNSPTYMDGGWAVWVFDAMNEELDWLSNDDDDQLRTAIANDRVVFVRSGAQKRLDIVMIEYPVSMLADGTP